MDPRTFSRRLGAALLGGLVVLSAAPAVLPLTAEAAGSRAGADRLIVVWKPDGVVSGQVAGAATVSVSRPGRRSVVTASAGDLAATAARLKQDPQVAAVLPDVPVEVADWPATGSPNDPYFAGSQQDLPLIGMARAWQTTTGSSSVVVAVLDTGVDVTHPEFAGTRIVAPRNEIADTTDVMDHYGHGTHVAGTIAAAANNAAGVTGMAPGVSLMPVKVLGDNGSGWFSDILDGVDWARAHGANVITMSLGGALDPTYAATLQPVFDAAYAAGITVDASAGNSGTNSTSYPAAFNHVISVAATDNAGVRASFSTFGATVDVAAPGVSIASTYLGHSYTTMSGTSMAAPHVAAAAALVRSAHPGYTVDQVEAALLTTADDKGAAGRDDYYGAGLIDVGRAVAFQPGDGPVPPSPSPAVAPSMSALSLSPATINYDATGAWCPAAVKSTTVVATTANASASVAPAAVVTLQYTRSDGSTGTVPMTRGAIGTTGTSWSATISTTTDRTLSAAGIVPVWAVASSDSGGTYRYPAGTGTVPLTVKTCADPAPVLSGLTVAPPAVYTNPLGSGSVPASAATAVRFSLLAADGDGVAAARVAITGGGLAAPVSLPLTLADGVWSATFNPTAAGVTGSGMLSWSATVTDSRGAAAFANGPALTVVRADTAASFGRPALTLSAANVPALRFTVGDPDAFFGATTTTDAASVVWTASYVDPYGVARTTSSASVRAAYAGSGSFAATLAAPWLTTAVSGVVFHVTPVSTDPYRGTTTGSTVDLGATAAGAPTIFATVSPALVYTNPLASGSVPPGASDKLPITVSAADTDRIASAMVNVSGPGLAVPRTVHLANTGGSTWSATLDVSTSGVTGSGTLYWTASVVDVAGHVATSARKSVSVVRADSGGSSSVASVSVAPNGVTMTVSADDPDATFSTTTNLGVAVSWTATYTNAFTGATVTTGATTTTATFVSGHTFRAVIAPAWFTTAARNVVLHLSPRTTDPYHYVSVGTARDVAVTAVGAPTIAGQAAGAAAVSTNPLGTGVVPAGLSDKLAFAASVTDTDAVARVQVVLSGAGLAEPIAVDLVRTSVLAYATTVDLSHAGVTATGTLSWKIVAVDAAGNAAESPTKTVSVTRANTAGAVAVTAVGYDAYGNVVVTITADDPDATFGTTTNLAVSLRWSATIGSTLYSTRTTTSTYRGNHTFTVVLPVGTSLTAARTASFTWTPIALDPYRGTTTGVTTAQTIPSRS